MSVPEQEHDRVADQHEEEADDLERQGDKLDEEIKEARDDWDAKKRDESIPGAQEEEDKA
ncbi:MAG TPA: hypothetical protein VGF74_19680 [Thermoleophilaceae bacterium]